MKVRLIAGLGMTLLAAGLMTLYFLDPDFPGFPGRSESPAGEERELPAPGVAEVEEFLADYEADYVELWTAAAEADWNWRCDASAANRSARDETRAALREFVGGVPVVEKLRMYRDRVDLSGQQDRSIETAWRMATRHPARAAEATLRCEDLVLAALDTLATAPYRAPAADGEDRSVARGEAFGLLAASRDTAARSALWSSLVALGAGLKDGVIESRDLRNETARRMGYASWFDFEAADHDLSGAEMKALLDGLLVEIGPLYRQIHCWVKHELARRYGVEAPRLLPAHWLDDPWGSDWSSVIEGPDLDTALREVQPRWIAETAERLYTSLGFEPLPLSFWGRSDLYAVADGSAQRKHAVPVTLHVDLDRDVRSLMHLESDFVSLDQAHRQIATAMARLATARPGLTPLLRRPASGAFEHAWPEQASLTVHEPGYLQGIGILAEGEAPEPIRDLMHQALVGGVVSLPFLLGTLSHWESDLYDEELPRHLTNTRWWAHAARFQGVEPPLPRGEDVCDPAALDLVYSAPARSYDAALGKLVAHQLQGFLCREILGGTIHTTVPAGDRQAGRLLNSLMAAGAEKDWQMLLRQATGEELSARALLEYYDPLLAWLEVQNEGRDCEF